MFVYLLRSLSPEIDLQPQLGQLPQFIALVINVKCFLEDQQIGSTLLELIYIDLDPMYWKRQVSSKSLSLLIKPWSARRDVDLEHLIGLRFGGIVEADATNTVFMLIPEM